MDQGDVGREARRATPPFLQGHGGRPARARAAAEDVGRIYRGRAARDGRRTCLNGRHTYVPDSASLRLSPTRETEIVDELSQHLEDRYRELIAEGTSPDEATRVALAPQVQSDAKHRATRVDEDARQTEVRAVEVICRESFLGRVVEHIEEVAHHVDSSQLTNVERVRCSEIEQGLGRQPARSARFEQDPLVALRQRNLRRRGPRLAAEVLQVAADREATPCAARRSYPSA